MTRRGWAGLAALTALRLGAQAPAKTAPAKTEAPLESVRVTGNRQIPAEKILAVAALKLGELAAKSDFDAARERLVATGAFETVGYEYKPGATGGNYDLTIEVHEIDSVFPYRFAGLPVAESVLRDALREQEPLWGDQIPMTAVERYVDTIAQSGVKMAVTWKLEEVSPGAMAIVFQPAATLPSIAEVRFEGNDALPAATLIRPINDVAIGVPYTEKALRERLDAAIRPLYDARGRIRVAFPKIAVEKAEKVDGVVATVTVEEGPVYRLGDVRFSGVADAEAAQLARSADLHKGDPANFDDVRAAVERVEKKYRGNGYLHVASQVNREVHDDDRSVNVTIALDLGAQYRFGKLTIKGLDLLTEPEIRKAWGQMEGRPYQPEYANEFLDRLRAEKVFENLGNTSAEPHIDERSKTVDVTLTFSGAAKNTGDSAGGIPGLPGRGNRPPGR